ncbi:glycosyltransferase family 2 protein [Paenibacillus sp. PsM32]|uniref:glycosyltransferase family 2 protein n=1 Tax=Paenibacillus sp. PsM32 TaxID=3030536 RepID=UPI00263BA859|nr:glycosyltransferase family 2 protein [Paenibacillus sp. PsM32]MDN4620689.1 glycosyltransferase family 2 protein [Paenibacillus sp. PsM32]
MQSKNSFLSSIAGILGIQTTVNLSPVSDLQKMETTDSWRSIGLDPHFLLRGTFYEGWNKIKLRSKSDNYIPLKIYWDNGEGFLETNTSILTVISNSGEEQELIFYIPPKTRQLRLDPGEAESEFELSSFEFKKITKLHLTLKFLNNKLKQNNHTTHTALNLFKKSMQVYKRNGLKGIWAKIKHDHINNHNNFENYQLWCMKNNISSKEKVNIKQKINMFKYKPNFSIIVPVYNVDEIWLRKCIDSVINQLYPHWELCISDDCSNKPHIKQVLNEYQQKDNRIKVVFRDQNGHISESSNSAIQISTGDYIALLDHDDELTIDALYEVAAALNANPNLDMIYTDEDKIDMDGKRHSPFFKPDWSPDFILSQMYSCHLGVYRKSLVDQVGGFRKGLEGSQDFDLVLRLTELTNNIHHIPKILYHWRAIPESTASGSSAKSYTHYAGVKALEDALSRRNIKAKVNEIHNYSNMYRVQYTPEYNPLVTIIIPTKDGSEILDTCLQSIFSKTSYDNFEIIIINNQSKEMETLELFEKWTLDHPHKITILDLDIPFNYSRLNNIAAQHAKGELLLFLNNDIEVISENWLEEMVGYALRDNTAAVGAKLLYPDNTVQHSGVIMGLGGIAGHAFRTLSQNDPGYFGMLLVNRNCSVVTAACLMVKKQIFKEVGGFEEKLTVAFNDVDLCLKFLSKGYYNVCLNSIELYHFESKTRGAENTPEKQKRFEAEIEYMAHNWPDIIQNDIYYNPNLSLESDRSYNIKV